MDNVHLPEIQTIADLLEELGKHSADQTPALHVISQWMANRGGVSNKEGFLELIRIVQSLPKLVAEMPPRGARTVALSVIERVSDLFEPHRLTSETRHYVSQSQRDIDIIQTNLPLFHDFKFEADRLLASQPEILGHIEQLKAKVGTAESLSDASRTVLFAQLDLVARSVMRFQTSGVGPFRDSIFSLYGRVVIQLEKDEKVNAEDKRLIIDDVLRLYDLAQVGGDLLQIAGPVVQKLLPHLT